MPVKTTGVKMSCSCTSQASSFYLDEAPMGFKDQLELIRIGDWIRLERCSNCGTLWSVDVWDKLQSQVVIKLESEDDFEQDSTDIRKNLLLKSRGGTSDDECIWAGCKNKAIKEVAYCLEHLWKTGARR